MSSSNELIDAVTEALRDHAPDEGLIPANWTLVVDWVGFDTVKEKVALYYPDQMANWQVNGLLFEGLYSGEWLEEDEEPS